MNCSLEACCTSERGALGLFSRGYDESMGSTISNMKTDIRSLDGASEWKTQRG
jgi:hypothetical protein